MSTAYTGVGAHVNTAAAVNITIPADGDPDNAATFDVGMQALADYAEAARVKGRSGAILAFSWTLGLQSGTFAASNTVVTLAPSNGATVTATMGSDVTATPATFRLTANVAGTYRVFLTRQLSNSTANTVNVTAQKNGATVFVPAQDFGAAVASGGANIYYVSEVYMTLAAADFVQAGFYGTISQTYSVGGSTPQWFGMERIA